MIFWIAKGVLTLTGAAMMHYAIRKKVGGSETEVDFMVLVLGLICVAYGVFGVRP